MDWTTGTFHSHRFGLNRVCAFVQTVPVRLLSLIGGNLSRLFAGQLYHRPRLGEPGVGQMSNEGRCDYHLRWKSTTGHMAVRRGNRRTQVFDAGGDMPFVLPPTKTLTFWSCESAVDHRPAGKILMLDCALSGLIRLEVTGLADLEELDCSHNQLASLDVPGLAHLRIVRAEGNPFSQQRG